MLLLLNFPVSFRKIFVLNILNYHKHESYYGVKGAYCNKLADFIIARCKWKSSTDGTCMGNGPPKSCGGPSIEILLTRHYLIWLVFPTFRFVVVANYWSLVSFVAELSKMCSVLARPPSATCIRVNTVSIYYIIYAAIHMIRLLCVCPSGA